MGRRDRPGASQGASWGPRVRSARSASGSARQTREELLSEAQHLSSICRAFVKKPASPAPRLVHSGVGARFAHEVSGSADRTVRVWSTASMEELCCLSGHRGKVLGLAPLQRPCVCVPVGLR